MSYVLQNVGLVFGGAYQRTIDSVFPTDQPPRAVRDHRDRDHLVAGLRRRRDDPAARRPVAVRRHAPARAGRCGPPRRIPDTAGLMGVDVNRTIAHHLPDRRRSWPARPVSPRSCTTTTRSTTSASGSGSTRSRRPSSAGSATSRARCSVRSCIGEVNAFSDRYLSPNWTQAIVFGVLIAHPRLQADRPPRPAAGGSGMSGATETDRHGHRRLARLHRSTPRRRMPGQLSRLRSAGDARRTIGLTHPRHRGRPLPGHRPLRPGRLQPQRVPAAVPGRHGRRRS